MDSQSIAVNREWIDKLQADKTALEKRVGELEAALPVSGPIEKRPPLVDYCCSTAYNRDSRGIWSPS